MLLVRGAKCGSTLRSVQNPNIYDVVSFESKFKHERVHRRLTATTYGQGSVEYGSPRNKLQLQAVYTNICG